MANLKLSCLAAAVAISTMIVGGANEKAQAQAALSASAFKQKATQYIQSWNDRMDKELKTIDGADKILRMGFLAGTRAQVMTLEAKVATAQEAVVDATRTLNSQLVGLTGSVFPDEGSALASFVSDQIKRMALLRPVTVSAKYTWDIKSMKLGSLQGNVTVRFPAPGALPNLPAK